MRSLIEHMVTMIVMMLMIFIFSFIITTGLEILDARLIHTSAIETIESSYYNVSESYLNDYLISRGKKDWSFNVEELNSVNTRKDYLVTLNYSIKLPLFGNDINGEIRGYAR